MNLNAARRFTAPGEASVLEARFGLRVCARLNAADAALPHDVSERLRIARDLAVSRAKTQKLVVQTASASEVMRHGDGSLSMLGGNTWWVRLGALLPLLVLIVGFVAMQEWEFSEQIAATADIDAALLSDTLPPEAYADPGFDEFLRSPDVPSIQ